MAVAPETAHATAAPRPMPKWLRIFFVEPAVFGCGLEEGLKWLLMIVLQG
jgi:hypothetical protein